MTAPCSRLLGGLLAAVVLAASAACGSDEPAPDPDRIMLTPLEDGGHTHAAGQSDATPVGDGTRPEAGGYRLVDVRLPRRADAPGELSFRILGPDGAPVTDYTEEQTKLLHLYVVRTDLTGFRHLHPVLGEDGTWSTRVDVGEPGDHRVLAEFTPVGSDRPVALGTTVEVPGRWQGRPPPTGDAAATGDDGVVRVEADGTGTVGADGRLRMLVTDLDGAPLSLGSYLGANAHLTGFEVTTGRFVHVHPYGAPEQTDDGTRLTFHTSFAEAGDYRFFLQVRVEGLVHTVAVTATVVD